MDLPLINQNLKLRFRKPAGSEIDRARNAYSEIAALPLVRCPSGCTGLAAFAFLGWVASGRPAQNDQTDSDCFGALASAPTRAGPRGPRVSCRRRGLHSSPRPDVQTRGLRRQLAPRRPRGAVAGVASDA
eukprot:10348133-Alexandrium_andersonii.AAC.1